MRILKILAYVLIVLIVVGLYSLNTTPVRSWAKNSIEAHLSKVLEKELTIGDLHFAFPFNLKLSNVTVNTPKLIKIDLADLQSSPLQFLLKDYRTEFTALGLTYDSVSYPDFILKGKVVLFENSEDNLLNLSFNSSATIKDILISFQGNLDLKTNGAIELLSSTISAFNESFTVDVKGSYFNETIDCEVFSKNLDLSELNQFSDREIFGKADLKAKIQYGPSVQLLEFESFLHSAKIENVSIEDTVISGFISEWLNSPKGKIKAIINEAKYSDFKVKRLCLETLCEHSEQNWHFKIANLEAIDNAGFFYLTGFWVPDVDGYHLTLAEAKVKTKQHVLNIQEPVVIYAHSKGITIPDCLLNIDDGFFKASAELNKEKVNVELRCENMPLVSFGKLFNSNDLDGTISGYIRCQGNPESLSGKFALHANNIVMENSPIKNPPKINASLEGSFSKDTLDIQGKVFGKDTQLASLDLKIPILLNEFRFDPVKDLEGNLKASGDITSILNQLFSLQNHATGKFDLSLTLSGNYEKPVLKGTGKLYEGSYESLDSGANFQNISAILELNDRLVNLTNFEGTDKQGGKITGTGILKLDPNSLFPFEVTLTAVKAELVHLDSAKGTASGIVTFKGNLDGASLFGQLTLDQLNVTITDQKKEVAPTLDITYINSSTEETPPTEFKTPSQWPITLDITILSSNNAFISAKDLTSEWKGEIKLNGTTRNPMTIGEFSIIKGEYIFNGKSFKLSQGTINFAGEPEKKTSLFVVAAMDIDDVIAEVVLKGSIKSPSISFRSNPALSQREILSLILFGKGISEISPFQGTELSKSITKLKSSSSGGTDFLGKLKTTLGIDRLQFNQDGQPGNTTDVSVQVGKYVTRGVFVGITRSIVSESNRVGVEANLMKNVKVQAEIGDDAEGQLNLKWKHDY